MIATLDGWDVSACRDSTAEHELIAVAALIVGRRICEDYSMATVYVEARPKGRPEGSPITDYVVENHADSVLHTSSTQSAAITWAKSNGHDPHVARVRHLNDKKKPDHWRKV